MSNITHDQAVYAVVAAYRMQDIMRIPEADLPVYVTGLTSDQRESTLDGLYALLRDTLEGDTLNRAHEAIARLEAAIRADGGRHVRPSERLARTA